MTGLIGATFGEFRLEQELGRGSQARVFLARSTVSGQVAAVKLFLPPYSNDPVFYRLLDDYIRKVIPLRHPNLVAVLSTSAVHEQTYLAMEYVAGVTLRARLRHSNLPLLDRLIYLHQSATAVEELHRKGLFHGNITTANILLETNTTKSPTSAASLGTARLSDYGLTLLREVTEGDAAYIAPERWKQNQMGAAADIYALGIVLYELCVGRVPFHAGTRMEAAQKHNNEPLPPIRFFAPDIPVSIETIINTCLEKDPIKRYNSAFMFAKALHEAYQPLYPPAPQPVAVNPVSPMLVQPPPSLIVLLENASGQRLGEWSIRVSELRVGRDSKSEIPLPLEDAMISRSHARIVWNGRQVTVEDTNSANGTTLAGQRLPPGKPVPWHLGAEVRIGSYRLLLTQPLPQPVPGPVVVTVPPVTTQELQPATSPTPRGGHWVAWVLVAIGLGILAFSLALPGVAQVIAALLGLLLLICAAVSFFTQHP